MSGGYYKQFKDLTIPDLERMRGPEYLGEEADTLIAMMYRSTEDRNLSEEEIRSMRLEEFWQEGETK